ncbi:MAG: spore cortex biosynthesis protein YabQ, partial [Clostridia bacterium]|nr:spore cortex biosynthesis protein YabQ [Clostridia bacterium]
HGNVWIGIEDICYWFFCTGVVFLLLYQGNDGRMRGFAFLGIHS